MIAAYSPGRTPLLALAGYGILVAGLLTVTLGTAADLLARREAVTEAQDLLDRMQGRKPLRPDAGADALIAGSPFLEGPTVTVAGAGLVERVTGAVARAGGRVTSSRVELEATPYGPGFIAVAVALDIAQPDLQKLLYDVEAGQPFLFVDQLVIQGQGASEAREGRLQVTATIYGRWQGAL